MIETQFTRNVTIKIFLDNYDFESIEGIDVEVNTGFEIKHVHIYGDDLDKVRASRRFRIEYESLYLFDFSELKVTCKYPIKVYCNKYTIGYIRGIEPTQEEK